MWQTLCGWLASVGKSLRARATYLQAARILGACALSHLFAKFAGLQEGYWAVISAIVVTQPLLDETIQASRTRLAGTLAGALCGFLVLEAAHYGLSRIVMFWCALGVLALATAISQSLRLSGITLTVVVLIPSVGLPFARPLDRVFGILIGVASSIAVSVALSGGALARMRALRQWCAGSSLRS